MSQRAPLAKQPKTPEIVARTATSEPRVASTVPPVGVQRRAAEGNLLTNISILPPRNPDGVQRAAASGTRDAGSPLPYLQRIQTAFGSHDVSGIRAHQGRVAALSARSLGAEAFAYGNHAVFGSTPSLRTAAHEAAHAVQQRSGRVQLSGGLGREGDSWERHADEVAERVVQGRSAQDLLDRVSPGQAPSPGAVTAGASSIPGVQRTIMYRNHHLGRRVFEEWLAVKGWNSQDDMEILEAVNAFNANTDSVKRFESFDMLYRFGRELANQAKRQRAYEQEAAKATKTGKPTLNIPPDTDIDYLGLSHMDPDEVRQNLPMGAVWRDLEDQAKSAEKDWERIVQKLIKDTDALTETITVKKHVPEIPEKVQHQRKQTQWAMEQLPELPFSEEETAPEEKYPSYKPMHFKTKTTALSGKAPLKEVRRTRVKANAKYGEFHAPTRRYIPDYSRVLDVLRATLTFKDFKGLLRAMRIVQLMQGVRGYTIVRCKQTYDPKHISFYGDVKMNLREDKSGHICELQFTLKDFLAAKQDGHGPYNVMRNLNPLDESRDTLKGQLSYDEMEAYDKAVKESQRVYGPARKKLEADPDFQAVINEAKAIGKKAKAK